MIVKMNCIKIHLTPKALSLRGLFFFLITLLLTCSAVANTGAWPVNYKAALLARVINVKPQFNHYNDSGKNNKELSFRIAKNRDFFTRLSIQDRRNVSMNIFKMIFSYVLGDSLSFYSKLKVIFYQIDSPIIQNEFVCGPSLKDSLSIGDDCLEGRFVLLSNVLIEKCIGRIACNGKYKNRMLAFRFPGDISYYIDRWDEIHIDNYANALASIMYDYVLKRDNHILPNIYIDFSRNGNLYDTINTLEHTYSVSSEFLRGIKEFNLMAFHDDELTSVRPYYKDDYRKRRAVVSYLSQVQVYSYVIRNKIPSITVVIDVTKGKIFCPTNDTLAFAKSWADLFMGYVLSDSLNKYKDLSININLGNSLLWQSTFPVNDSLKCLNINQKIKLLLKPLPYVSQYVYNDDELDVSLTAQDAFSRNKNSAAYLAVLAYALYNFMHTVPSRNPTIDLIDDHRRISFYPTLNDYNNVKKYLDQF